MKREIDLVMFDLDGTLADTGRDLADAVNQVRSRLGLEPLEERRIYDHVGRGSEYLIRSSLPEEYRHRFGEMMGVFFEHYGNHLLDHTVLYPHVRETLEYFRRKKRVLVSNKLRRFSLSILSGLGIEKCFDSILGGDSLPQKKPDPQPLNETLAAFRVKPGKALMVGDGASDIEAGKKAGVYTCGVTYGLGRREDLVEAGPDLLIDDLGRLVEHFS